MANKENIRVPFTRSQAKKTSTISVQPPFHKSVKSQPVTKKRKALADITSLMGNEISESKRNTRARKNKEERVNAVESDINDLEVCSHYDIDVHSYLKKMEIQSKRRPVFRFIEKVQNDITPNMRATLVNWLVEVAEEYKLLPETLYLTISYIDRFLSAVVINRSKLQLLGVSAMLIASKYEEISPPHVEDFCYITDNTYTKHEVVKMEADVLKFLNFEMGNFTIKAFLKRYIIAGLDEGKYPELKLECLANYIAELSLVDYECTQFLPSAIAAAAVFVARFTIVPTSHPWSLKLQEVTNYKPSELKDCIKILHELQLNKRNSNHTAVREKYTEHKFKFVSGLVPPSELLVSYFEDSNIL